MTRVEQNQWSAQQTLSYINGLIAAEENEDENTILAALSIAYQYLINATKRKITWSLSLEKLAYEFIDLAFETNMHSSVKDIFKSYRAITQGQYSQSLKCVLEHYRDTKLENILDEDISKEDISIIRALPNIENEEPSTEIIMQSMHIDVVKREMEIRNKLRIVWEGYKSIVETVRVNQKLEDVYMTTLTRVFDFVDRYNRVQEFKSFCRSLRTGLQSAFNKRDRTYQEKTIYIDIEKTDVNTRNIEIRMEQFKVTTKLGLWGEAFTVLEDINTLMKIRKAPLKNSLRCQYFENLALLFSKNNFWHYHAYAFYNFYLSYLTKPRLSQEEKQNQADKLLLSILIIPTLTIESQQSRDIQEKLSSMLITSTKVPDRNHLEELMVSKGVLENASAQVRQLWNFMFLEFGVGSLKKGLEMVSGLGQKNNSFKELLQACLINKQLISIAEIYQRIRIKSLERLIPLPLHEIKKMLILAHRQKAIDFTFDESQGIIVFEESQQVNPSEEFHNLFMSVALACERGRTVEEQHIRKKAEDFIENAERYIWDVRNYKIEQFKKKIKTQLPELRKKYLAKKKADQERREAEQNEEKVKQAERIRESEEAHKLLAAKKIIIKDIMEIKEQRVVRILDKKIQNLTDEEIENIDLETFKQYMELTKRRITNNKDTKLKKAFTHVDYLERERRYLLAKKVQDAILSPEQEKEVQQTHLDSAKKNHQDHNQQKAKLQNLAKFYKNRVESELKKVYSQFDKDMEDYYQRLEENFKEKIISKAKSLHEENQRKKEQQLKLQEQQRWAETEQYRNGAWSFSKKRVENTPAVPTLAKKQESPQTIMKKPVASNNIFEKLEGVDNKEKPKKAEGKWGIGTKRVAEPQKKPQQTKKDIPAIERPERPREENNNQKWSFGSKKAEEVKSPVPEPVNTQKKAVFAPPPPTSTAPEKKKWGEGFGQKKEERKPEPRKEEKKPTAEIKKGKGW